jgi:branched-chain amino acid transport system substrate-binding protein
VTPGLKEIKVGMPVSRSGQFRVQGRQALTGLQAWAADANRSGGLLVSRSGPRRKVRVVYHDDAGRQDQVRQVTERLIVYDKVDLLLGPYSSVLARASAAVAEEHEVVLWNQGGASDDIYQSGFRWVVGILTPASRYLADLGSLLKETCPRAATLAIIQSSTGSFPRAVAGGAAEGAQEAGLRVTLRREYDPTATDFTEILAEVAAAQPDALLAVGRIGNDLDLARQLARSKVSLGAAAVVAAPIQQFRDALGRDAEGFIGPSQWEPNAGYEADYGPAAGLVMASLLRLGPEPVDYPMVQAYAAGLVAQRCLEEAGDLEPATLRAAAARLDFSTFYGRFKIDPDTGRQVGRSGVVVQWQQRSKVVVWPPEQRQARLVYPWRG